ncbi:MAG: multicopper oxidase family protein [Sporichthyaceae bacterium]
MGLAALAIGAAAAFPLVPRLFAGADADASSVVSAGSASSSLGPGARIVSAADPKPPENAPAGASAEGDVPGRPITGPLTQAAKNLPDGTRLAAWRVVDDVKIFELTLARTDVETQPGIVKKGISVNGGVPAPTIRVNQGERVRFVVKNQLDEVTAIHWHGMVLPNIQDGVPGITQRDIPAGATFTYEWTAITTGTHWYHSHAHGDQEGRGVYGGLQIVPLAGDIASDRDYTLIFGDGPLGFVINGRGFPYTKRMPVRVGERVRIRLVGAGPDLIHSIHLHLGNFEVMAQDGNMLPVPYRADTIVLGVGQTFDLLWTPDRTGAWMLHCHIFAHSETKKGMTGMVTLLDVLPADSIVVPRVPGSPIVASRGRGV